MVVLEREDCPIEPGLTGAESAVLNLWHSDSYFNSLVIIPDLPALWPGLDVWTIYLDPALILLALGLTAPDRQAVYRDPTVESYYLPEKRQGVTRILLWLTEETAARTSIRYGRSTPGVQVLVEGGQITFELGPGVQVVSNRTIGRQVPTTVISVSPSWREAYRPQLYPEYCGMEDYYVQIDSYDLSPPLLQSLEEAYPGHPLGECRQLREYHDSLSDLAQSRLDERWGSCGLCEEPLVYGYVYDCCQYPVCTRCHVQLARSVSLSNLSCPHCRQEGPGPRLCGTTSTRPLRDPMTVYRQIQERCPKARVLLIADPARHTWGGERLEHAVSWVVEGAATHQDLDGHLVATHVLSLVPPDHLWHCLHPSGPAPIQMYYLGLEHQSHIRAAADEDRLEQDHLTVEVVEHHPTPARVLEEMLDDLPEVSTAGRILLRRTILHAECLHADAGWLDIYPEQIWLRGRSCHLKSKRGGRLMRCTREEGAWWEEGVRHTGEMPCLTVDGQVLNLQELWCRLDPGRRTMEVPEEEEEELSE